jgi:hypothetical protein
MTKVIPLDHRELARVAPNWEAMRTAIAQCESVDEVRELADKATAIRAYFAQSKDTANEMHAMRIRLRAERRFGELYAAEQAAGRMAKRDDNLRRGPTSSPSTSATLASHGIPRDRAARAKKLASVPAEQFEAALSAPRPSLRSLTKRPAAPSMADTRRGMRTWSMLRDLAAAIDDATLLHPRGWRSAVGLQAFQVHDIDSAIPIIARYLAALSKGDTHE